MPSTDVQGRALSRAPGGFTREYAASAPESPPPRTVGLLWVPRPSGAARAAPPHRGRWPPARARVGPGGLPPYQPDLLRYAVAQRSDSDNRPPRDQAITRRTSELRAESGTERTFASSMHQFGIVGPRRDSPCTGRTSDMSLRLRCTHLCHSSRLLRIAPVRFEYAPVEGFCLARTSDMPGWVPRA